MEVKLFNKAFDSWILAWAGAEITPKQFYTIAAYMSCRVRNFEGSTRKERKEFFKIATILNNLHHG